MDELLLLIRAGYPVVYITTHEEARVLDCIARVFRVLKTEQPGKHLLRWSQGEGLQEINDLKPAAQPSNESGWQDVTGLPTVVSKSGIGRGDPHQALEDLRTATAVSFMQASDCIAIFTDIHPHLYEDHNSGTRGFLIRPLRNTADAMRRYYDDQRAEKPDGQKARTPPASKTIIVVAPSDAHLSGELKGDLYRIAFPLPEQDELQRALDRKLATGQLSFPDPIPEEEIEATSQGDQRLSVENYKLRVTELIAGAGRGLTLADYNLGLNKIAARGDHLRLRRVRDMLDLKAKAISSRALSYTPNVEIELGGLDKVIDWLKIRRAAAVSEKVRQQFLLPPPRGIMFCGASGGGKSQLAKRVAKEFNLALLRLDVGSLFGSYVGESERYTREALEMAEVLAPVVLWIDEIDKAFKGIGGGGDSGVAARVFGYFLTWLSEKQDTVFVVVTANDFEDLLGKFPEFGRKGRFDQIFWVSLPSPESRSKIFKIHLQSAFEACLLEMDEPAGDGRPAGPDEAMARFERFCDGLASWPSADRLTGAEIEHVVTQAKYKAYSNSEQLGVVPRLTRELLIEALDEVGQQALYGQKGSDREKLEKLQTIAAAKGWPIVS